MAKDLLRLSLVKATPICTGRRQSASVLKTILSSSGRGPASKSFMPPPIFLFANYLRPFQQCLSRSYGVRPASGNHPEQRRCRNYRRRKGRLCNGIHNRFVGAGRRDYRSPCRCPSHGDEGEAKAEQLSIAKSAAVFIGIIRRVCEKEAR